MSTGKTVGRPFPKGKSGNPGGRSRAITNLGVEARKYADLALETLVQVCTGKLKSVTPRDRVAAANALLDRGFGKPTQALDLVLIGRKLNELSIDELNALNASLVSAATIDVTEHAAIESDKIVEELEPVK
jgi:hypothetical protein